MKKIAQYSLVLFVFLFAGCFSKNSLQAPKNIEEIKENKIKKRKQNIRISERKHKNYFQVYLSDENKIKHICVNSNCDYKNDKANKILMYQKVFYPSFSRGTRNIQCGIGSFAGVFILANNIDIKNHSKQNEKLCDNRFTKLDSTQLFSRVATGIFTLGTSIITSGTMHTVKFDELSFKDAIVESSLDFYQKELFDFANINTMKSGLDVIYLNSSNTKQQLKNYYQKLLESKHTRDGLIIIDENSHHILSVIDYRKYTSNDIMKNIADEIENIFDSILLREKEVFIKENDILELIPKEVKKPKLPELPILKKDEFETKKEFKDRVLKSVKQRENIIKDLQNNYNLDILRRNEYINTLEKVYQEYLSLSYNESYKIKKNLEDNLDLFIQILFIQNLNGLKANNFKYDAEKQRLYFKIYSKNKYLKQKAFAVIPKDSAKNMKIDETYYFEPIVNYKNRFISLRGLEIIDTNSNERYKIKYTNINFIPNNKSVVIKTKKEKISNIETNDTFKKFKQRNSSIVNNQKEFWYINLVDTLNSKVPKWFSEPKNFDMTVAYASDTTYEEAKIKAINDLAIAKGVKIKSQMKAQTQFDNRLKEYTNFDKKIIANVDKSFKENEFIVLRQEKVDGIWYISLKSN